MLKQLLVIAFTLVLAWVQAQPNQWKTLETSGNVQARHENAFVECAGKFYLLGGRRINHVNVFDPKTNTWTSKAKTPMEFHHFQPVVYKKKIYLLGVMTGKFPNEKAVPTIWVYHPKTDTWEKGAEIPANRRRGSAGVVVHKNKFYMVCGIVDGHNGGYVNWFDVYDPKTNAWKILPDAPRPRDHFAAVVANNKLFAATGRTTSKRTGQVFQLTVPEVDYFDFTTQTWHSLAQNLPTGRAGSAVVAYKNYIVTIGGESGTQKKAHKQVEAFNLKTNTWETWPQLNTGRHGTQAFVYKKHVYIAAGCANRGGSPEQKSIERLSLKAQTN